MPAAGVAGAEVVVADDSLGGEGPDCLADDREILGGDGLVDKHPEGRDQQPHAGVGDCHRDDQRHDGVDPAQPGDLGEDEPGQDAAGDDRVGAQVRASPSRAGEPACLATRSR